MAKELEDGEKAVGLFNLSQSTENLSVKWEEVGLNSEQQVRDLWRQKNLGAFENGFSRKVPAHGVCLIRVSRR